VNWGKIFTVATNQAFTIKSVCLIKPGATTHAFDQDQRFVPLSFVAVGSPIRLLVTAPADSNLAPPGDYLLFLVDGSATASEVPSVATWTKVDRYRGRDSADVVVPATITDMAFEVSSTSITVEWTAPADDASLVASGSVQTYDIRYSTNPITDVGWGSVPQAPFTHTPAPPGNPDYALASGLLACRTYHFAGRALDDNNQHGANSADVTATTMCRGGGGGFALAHTGGGATGSAAAGSGAMSLAGAASSPAAVVVLTTRTGVSTWRVVARPLADAASAGFDGAPGMFVQMPDGDGGESPAVQVPVDANDSELGLCTLRDGRRVTLVGGYSLQAVASGLRVAGSDYVLTSAVQGSVGEMGADFVYAGGPVSVAPGDSLVLTYQAAPTVLVSPGSWFLSLAHAAPGALAARPAGGWQPPLPVRFALRQNLPNPFTAATTIRFDLPVGAAVRLDLFDAQGRRVRTLANRYYPAGYHALRWSPSESGDARMGPGVYFYRIEAGPFRDRKKMVLVGD
jgi:hypothetical protein